MKIEYKTLLYDISNLAFVIADNGDDGNHPLHRVRDIVEDGNIDRVARVLGLAYARILGVLSPLIRSPRIDICRDISAQPHDYFINFRGDGHYRFRLTKELKLRIKETAHEYMVCMVLADWLDITLPPAADVWRYRAEGCIEALNDMAASVSGLSTAAFGRTLSPF